MHNISIIALLFEDAEAEIELGVNKYECNIERKQFFGRRLEGPSSKVQGHNY